MVYFLSDAHLGSRVMEDPEAHQQRLVSLLERMAADADAVCLLGDVFDFWYEYVWERGATLERLPRGKERFRPLLECLRRLTGKGIPVHYLIGNHDIWTFGWLERMTGVQIHRHAWETEFYGRRVLLAHGDGLVPRDYMERLPKEIQKKIRAFMRLRAFFHHPVPQFLFSLLPPSWGDSFGYEWARRSRRKEIDNPCPYKGENQEELVLYAKEEERQGRHRDIYLFGHRHIELDLELESRSRVLILGDFFKQWTYAQLDKKGNILLQNYETHESRAAGCV
jgi:UDP-2,3-diacylglucosamine hydrolase